MLGSDSDPNATRITEDDSGNIRVRNSDVIIYHDNGTHVRYGQTLKSTLILEKPILMKKHTA